VNRKEKLEAFKQKGWTYNKETGEVFTHKGKVATGKSRGYIICHLSEMKTALLAHQLAWYLETGEVPDTIDHYNHIKDDNRFANLKSGTQQQNRFNTKNTKGYFLHKKINKYVAQIMINGKNIRLGNFNTKEEAHQAYLEAKKIYHIA
jgi:HNH endonuclease